MRKIFLIIALLFSVVMTSQQQTSVYKWNAAITYNINDLISYQGVIYKATASNTNDLPPSGNWELSSGLETDPVFTAEESNIAKLDGSQDFTGQPYFSNYDSHEYLRVVEEGDLGESLYIRHSTLNGGRFQIEGTDPIEIGLSASAVYFSTIIPDYVNVEFSLSADTNIRSYGGMQVDDDPTADIGVGNRGYNDLRYEPLGGQGGSPLTTKGDLYTYDTNNQRLAVGTTDGFVLSVDAAEPTGLKWVAPATGDVSKVGTPVDNQIGVWTGDGTLEGDANLTWASQEFQILGKQKITYTGADVGTFQPLRVDVSGSTLSVEPVIKAMMRDDGFQKLLQAQSLSDTYSWLSVERTVGGSGKPGIALGSGTAGRDTNLYRDGANLWKTDDNLEIAGYLQVDGSITGGILSHSHTTTTYTTNTTENGKHITFTTATPTTITLDDAAVTVGNQFHFLNKTGGDLTFAYGTTDTAYQGTLPDLGDGQYAWATLTEANTWSVIVGGISGGGDVSKVGTPVNNELGVWTGDGTLEGESNLTYDGTNLTNAVGGLWGVTSVAKSGYTGTVGHRIFNSSNGNRADFISQAFDTHSISPTNTNGVHTELNSYMGDLVIGNSDTGEITMADHTTFMGGLEVAPASGTAQINLNPALGQGTINILQTGDYDMKFELLGTGDYSFFAGATERLNISDTGIININDDVVFSTGSDPTVDFGGSAIYGAGYLNTNELVTGTLAETKANTVVFATAAIADITLTIPDTWTQKSGAQITIVNISDYIVTIAVSGTATLNGNGTNTVVLGASDNTGNEAVQLIQSVDGSDDWYTVGKY